MTTRVRLPPLLLKALLFASLRPLCPSFGESVLLRVFGLRRFLFRFFLPHLADEPPSAFSRTVNIFLVLSTPPFEVPAQFIARTHRLLPPQEDLASIHSPGFSCPSLVHGTPVPHHSKLRLLSLGALFYFLLIGFCESSPSKLLSELF